MFEHKGHNVLGKYCWDCRANLTSGTPGFPRRDKSDGPRVAKHDVKDVVWADATHDDTDSCVLCGHAVKCKHPVHTERYQVKQTALAKAWDRFNPVI